MDETMIGWIFLLIMLVWKYLGNFQCVQTLFHCCCNTCGLIFQWYTWAFIGLLFALLRTVWDIIRFDYIQFAFLNPELVQQSFHRICQDLSELECTEATEKYTLTPLWRWLSLSAPVAGALAFVILSVHTGRKIRRCFQWKSKRELKNPWALPKRFDFVLVVNAVPLLFIVMSMRALIRVWTVFTGSCWREGMSWESQKSLETSTAMMDLEIAATFQFFAVYLFALLINDFLKHSKYIQGRSDVIKEYKRAVSNAALLVVYAYVFIGVARAMCDFSVAFLEEPSKKGSLLMCKPFEYFDMRCPENEELIQYPKTWKKNYLDPINVFLSIMLILNMGTVAQVQDLKDALGDAKPGFSCESLRNLMSGSGNTMVKFTGARLLILAGQIQPNLFPIFGYNQSQSMLAHVTLLQFESLIVVIITVMFWHLRGDEQFDRLMWTEKPSNGVEAREVHDPENQFLVRLLQE